MASCSGTSLVKKLGIKPGFRVKTIGAPADYFTLLKPIPNNVLISSRLREDIDIWHIFIKQKAGLSDLLKKAMASIQQNGMIWVSWPKKASGVRTDMSEDEIRHAAIPLGLVDVKVCAVDDTWSGLKFMIRRSHCNET